MDPGLIRHATASHASSKQQSRIALVGKKDSRKMAMDVARESRKNVLGSGNRDAVIGARRLRYGTTEAVLGRKVAQGTWSRRYNLNPCEVVATVDHEMSWRGTDSWAKSDDGSRIQYPAPSL